MTSEDYDKLTDDEKRIKIARLHGYYKQIVDHGEGYTPYSAWFKDGLGHHLRHDSQLPNYLEDLNACHEFENANITHELSERYNRILFDTCTFEGWHPERATAKQRCKAFVLTMTEGE
jgi:hypothetical protein